jgi:hypothetical protein
VTELRQQLQQSLGTAYVVGRCANWKRIARLQQQERRGR